MRTTEERVTNLEEILAGTEREIRELRCMVNRLSKKAEGENRLEKGSEDSFRLDRKSMNKQWAKVIGKIGSIDKDIIALEVPFLLEKYFKCEKYNTGL
jgi:chromosome segregation ATPase